MTSLFDLDLRRQRRDRAARLGFETFLLERAFDDCIDRIGMVQRTFETALLVGCPDPSWPERLNAVVSNVEVFDPGAILASNAGGHQADERELPVLPESYDLILAVGTLDSANQLDEVFLRFRLALKPDGLLLGAMSGGETLPALRVAMRAADEVMGSAAPHVHPRIAPAALTGLLSSAGLKMPVVDVDRVRAAYPSLRRLLNDLRKMAATNLLVQRSTRPITKSAYQAAAAAFLECGDAGQTIETFEILHFAGWAPPTEQAG
ncbi:SAM-dependent methyltransferase [Sphingomonas piscis]|uniref:SAM-dependent methyltransferase n=1 Tax=Sphingomonas piscis TaxID=2714943 RepID=A0A6G7YMH8_9SPHN|nr:methyltransferase domain-containing protein [Sphingomonas piscis]QIK77942.1 SAM-dependent methyltransferase [Sphingomonas piscis]